MPSGVRNQRDVSDVRAHSGPSGSTSLCISNAIPFESRGRGHAWWKRRQGEHGRARHGATARLFKSASGVGIRIGRDDTVNVQVLPFGVSSDFSMAGVAIVLAMLLHHHAEVFFHHGVHVHVVVV
eukprot:2946889-Pyramimonas_sp.AAC.1